MAKQRDEITKKFYSDSERIRHASDFLPRKKYVSRQAALKAGVEFEKTKDPRIVSVVVPEIWTAVLHPANKAWYVAFRLVVQDTQPVIGEVRIFPTEDDADIDTWSAELLGVAAKVPSGGITARLIQATKTAGAVEKVAEQLRGVRLGIGARPEDQSLRAALDALAEKLPLKADSSGTKGKRGKPPKPHLFYAEFAQEYAQLVDSGERHPRTVIVSRKKRKYPGLTESKVRDIIRQARIRKILSNGMPGRPGGQLTPYGSDLLRQHATAEEQKGAKQHER